MFKYTQLWLVLIGVLLLSACGEPYKFRGGTVEPPNQAAEITLTTDSGQPFRLSSLRGKVVMVFFGFTSCPDICPTSLADLADVRRSLGSVADKTQVVMVSLDPDRDTPERLHRYMTNFDPSFIGLRGTQAELAPILKSYNVTAIRRELPNSALKYTVDHSGFIYVIDPAGKWRLIFVHGMTPEDMASDVTYLLREGGQT